MTGRRSTGERPLEATEGAIIAAGIGGAMFGIAFSALWVTFAHPIQAPLLVGVVGIGSAIATLALALSLAPSRDTDIALLEEAKLFD